MTLLEKQNKLVDMVESMSNLKNETSKKGVALYINYKINSEQLIKELKKAGINEKNFPLFKRAMTSFRYWS